MIGMDEVMRMSAKQKIKYLYWRLRRVTCEDCRWYSKGDIYDEDPNCTFYGIFFDVEICHSSFQPKDKENKLKG